MGGSSLGPMVTSRALDEPRPRDCGLRQCSSAFSARLGGTGRPAGVELGTFFPPGEFSSDKAVGPEGEALLGQTLWRGSKRLLFPSPGRSMRGLFSSENLVEFLEVKLAQARGAGAPP